MNNYPTLESSTFPWNQEDDAVEYLKCYVSEDLFREEEMTLDPNTGRWFHKSKVKEYVSICAEEFGWNQEEVQDALKKFNQ